VTTVLVLVILAVIWAAVLLPPYLQNRRETRPGDSIAMFRSQLSVLERTTPGGRNSLSRLDVGRYDPPRYVPTADRRPTPSQAAMRRSEARRRRRDVFLTLVGAVGVTFVLAVALGGSVWYLQLLVDLALLGYVGMLVSLQQQSVEKDEKVRDLRPAPNRTAPDPQLLLRRSGS
jgi:nitrate reductase NapE component